MSQYYKKYMKKREEEKPSYIKLFVGAFLVVIVFSVILFTHSLAGVDTSIGEYDEGDIKESGLGVKHLIDSRLRFIKMEDESAGVQTKEKTADIQQYNRTIQEEAQQGYNGNFQKTYGYDATQEAKPYSQTYTNTQKQVPVTTAPSTTAVNKPQSAPATQTPAKTVPTPTAPSVPKPSTPSHNIQKNLTPTGMN